LLLSSFHSLTVKLWLPLGNKSGTKKKQLLKLFKLFDPKFPKAGHVADGVNNLKLYPRSVEKKKHQY